MTPLPVPEGRPSPFDPTPWPPWDQMTAAGAGALYGAMTRAIDEMISTDGLDRSTWAKKQIAEGLRIGTLAPRDAQRFSSLLGLSEPRRSARDLFEEALADPEATATAIGLLSLAQFEETHDVTDGARLFEIAMILGFTGGGAVYTAIRLAKHLSISITVS